MYLITAHCGFKKHIEAYTRPLPMKKEPQPQNSWPNLKQKKNGCLVICILASTYPTEFQ